MPLLEVTLVQTYQGQECVNRFNYVSQGTPAAVTHSFAVLWAMGFIPDEGVLPAGTVFAAIRAIQASSCITTQVLARDVYSNTDFYELAYIDQPNGSDGGEPASPVLASGFRTNRVRADIRRGTRRFSGVTEGAMSTGGSWVAANLTARETLATLMSEVLTYDDEGNTMSFTPVIVGKKKYNPDPLRPERWAYKYYPTLSEQLDHIAAGVMWTPYTQVRTQTSRQYGRGR